MCDQLWSEYEMLFGVYEAYNDQSLVLKGWSVTLSLAAIAAAYSEKVGTQGRMVVWMSAAAAGVFWLLDAFWKSYQLVYLQMLEGSEQNWACTAGMDGPMIIQQWEAVYRSWHFLTVLHYPSVFLPHVFVVVLGIGLALFYPPRSE